VICLFLALEATAGQLMAILEIRAMEPELKFQATAPASGIEILWYRIQHPEVFGSGSRMIWSIKN